MGNGGRLDGMREGIDSTVQGVQSVRKIFESHRYRKLFVRDRGKV